MKHIHLLAMHPLLIIHSSLSSIQEPLLRILNIRKSVAIMSVAKGEFLEQRSPLVRHQVIIG